MVVPTKILVGVSFAIGVLLVILVLFSKPREAYGFTTGRLGRYFDSYNQCLSSCEREDPGKFLAPTKGSLYCAQFCDAKYTGLARLGGPAYPKEPTVLGMQSTRREDACQQACAVGDAGKDCRHACFCDSEVNEKCRQDCAYSRLSDGVCMDLCRKQLGVNCSSVTWTWK